MSFGSPLDKRKVLPLVHTSEGKPVLWNEMLELNRMAFSPLLPRNSESRCISIAFKLIRKNAPHVKWILSFSDATQCGDGTIYRASGFALTAVRESKNDIWVLPLKLRHLSEKPACHRIAVQAGHGKLPAYIQSVYGNSNIPLTRLKSDFGGELLNGYQLRYIYLLDKTCKLNCPNLPYSEIDRIGAGMYKGQTQTVESRKPTTSGGSVNGCTPGVTSPKEGFDSTPPLFNSNPIQ